MIKIENIVTPSTEQWKSLIMGARNPMNSWDKSDSYFHRDEKYCEDKCPYKDETCKSPCFNTCIGEKDLILMKKLVNAGSDHSKFMRMINVTMDIVAPLYWWKEFDTYKVGTVRNSCSTMHKITEKEFELSDFSIDNNMFGFFVDTIVECKNLRSLYLETNDKKYWRALIQLLPSSYNQRATVQLNYAVLRNMYHSRKSHKLDEWVKFCEWIETLPYSELIIGGKV